MENLKSKLERLSKSMGRQLSSEPVTDYESLRRTYELQANDDVKKLQQKTKLERIASIHGRSDLNPKWVFDNIQKDSPDVAEAVSIAESFIAAHQDPSWRQSSAHMMLFYGDYGRGKSHIAGAIAHELIMQHEITVLYRQLSTLLDMRFFSYDFTAQDNIGEQFRELNHELIDVDLLILDEVGVNETQLKKNAQSWLGNLLRQRHLLKKNCIIITNHDLPQLYNALGPYCFESLKEYDTYKVKFSGNSRRSELLDEHHFLNGSTANSYKPNQVK